MVHGNSLLAFRRGELLLVRHGETDWNSQGRFQGHSDVSLNEHGRVQASRNGSVLKLHLAGEGISPPELSFVSSPLARARETARIVRASLGLSSGDCQLDERLREAGFGTWEGLTTLEVKERFRDQRKARKADRWNFRPPGGQSLADLEGMARSLLSDIPDGRKTVLVSHSGNIRVICGLLAGMSRQDTIAMTVPHDRVLSWDGKTWRSL